MSKSRFREKQEVAMLCEVDRASVAEVARKNQIFEIDNLQLAQDFGAMDPSRRLGITTLLTKRKQVIPYQGR